MRSPPDAGEPLDLLLIEDDPEDARLFEELLADGDLDVECRRETSLRMGLEALRDARPDVLVVDPGLPDSEGLETVRQVTDAFPDVPLVVLTGRADAELGRAAVGEGAQEYLQKGEVTSRHLVQTLRYALLRTRVGREIRDRDQRFRVLLSNVSDVISVIAPDGTVLYESPSAERILGYTPEELEGENILEYFHPDDRERVRIEIEELASTSGEERIGEARFRHADGSWRVLEARGRMPPAETDIDGIIVVSRDVTDRLRQERERERAQRRYQTLFAGSPVGVAVVSGEGRVVESNRALAEMLGYPPGELEGSHFADVTHPDDVEEDVRLYRRLQAGEIGEYQLEKRFITSSGEVVWGDLRVAAVRFPGEDTQQQVGFVRDITVEKRAREALRESEERFRQMAENINEVFWLRDPGNEEMLYVSPAFEEVTGRSPEELYRNPDLWIELIHPEDRDGVARAVREEARTSFQFEYRLVRPNGEIRWIRDQGFPVRDDDGRVYRVAGVARDVTERKRLEEQLRHRALHDPQTGLANRTLLIDRVEQGLARSHRSGGALGLLLVDVVRFRRINDRLGHAAGDRVLETLARRLQEVVREDDTVARWGGDEFVVVLPELESPDAIQEVYERVRDAIQRPIEAIGHTLHVDIRVGGVLHGEGGHPQMVETRDPRELVRLGDLALSRAKAPPGSRGFHLFDPDEEVEGVAQIRREQELRRGLDEDEFVPYYQPLVRLEDGVVAGFEVLARWDHPEKGILSPAEFILLSEELGLISGVGESVFRQGCRDAAAWSREEGGVPPRTVSFNLSGQQFEDPEMSHRLRHVVEETGLSPGEVILEVTETTVMQAPDAVDLLREMGFRIYIDDFGTGYSTFAYLRDLNLDGLKIDMSFVQKIDDSPTGAALVEAMIGLGRTLGLSVVAEGVETEEQRRRLREMGCELGQGYLFAGPVPAEDIPALLGRSRMPAPGPPADAGGGGG